MGKVVLFEPSLSRLVQHGFEGASRLLDAARCLAVDAISICEGYITAMNSSDSMTETRRVWCLGAGVWSLQFRLSTWEPAEGVFCRFLPERARINKDIWETGLFCFVF